MPYIIPLWVSLRNGLLSSQDKNIPPIVLNTYNMDKAPLLKDYESKRLAWVNEFEIEYGCPICGGEPFHSPTAICPTCGRSAFPTGYMYWRKGDYRQRIKNNGILHSPDMVQRAKTDAIRAVSQYHRDGNLGLVPWWSFYVLTALYKVRINATEKMKIQIKTIIDTLEVEQRANRPMVRRLKT